MPNTPPSHIVNLTAHWRLLGMMLVTLGRQLLRMERSGARDAYAKAEILEIGTRAALVILNRQIKAAEASAPCTDDSDLGHLKAIACMLMVLAMLLQDIKPRLAGGVNYAACDARSGIAAIVDGDRCEQPPVQRAGNFPATDLFDTS